MKQIDKTIIVITATIVIFALAYFGAFHLMVSLQVLSIILGVAYTFFVLMHLCFAFPLLAMIMIIDDVTRENVYIKAIKEKSKILGGLANLSIHIAAIYVVYLCVPLMIAMLYNCSFNVSDAFTRIDLVMGT
ncbi:MAG: hypothetical protein COA36_16725 [Desulfotalea sp.]|nr:MAG: hypothetical protein COA36_16725 [Desulfotalea sp.]